MNIPAGLPSYEPHSERQHLLLSVIAAVVVIGFWNASLLFPFRIFVVFLHEFSHAAMAWMTGGAVVSLHLSSHEGGQALTRGGSRFLILSAGYLGSLIWGGLILVAASRWRREAPLAYVLGGLTLVMTLAYVRPIFGFGFFYCLIFGAALCAAATWLRPWILGLLLRVIGLTSCLYVVPDIWSDTMQCYDAPSDARMLAQEYGGTVWMWGGLWLIVAVVLTAWFVLVAAVPPERSRNL